MLELRHYESYRLVTRYYFYAKIQIREDKNKTGMLSLISVLISLNIPSAKRVSSTLKINKKTQVKALGQPTF